MNKIKVYLQYPWTFPDSPYYKSLVDSPPKNIEYLNTKKQKGVITKKRKFFLLNSIKKIIRSANSVGIIIPNVHKSPEGNYDLIHCAHCLSKNENKPWVADIEMMPSFAISGWNSKKGIKKVKEILLKENCKRILPWTQDMRSKIISAFPEIKNKIEVVYPAIPEIKNLKKIKNKKLKIIFVARYFHLKGGLIALEVLEKLRKKYGIEGIIVSNVPQKLKQKYCNLKIYDLISQKELFTLMEKSDLFLYPSAVDTFGFSLLEAMAFGLPTITINTEHTQSRNEIIENNKTGLILDIREKISFDKIEKLEEEIISNLVKKTSQLIENKTLREKMSKECINLVKEGRFSIKERNKKLKRIYEKAIK